MAQFLALAARFPTREFEIHRLRSRDREFRRVCDDYELVVRALRHWEQAETNPARVDEYYQLEVEIAEEISMRLDAVSASSPIHANYQFRQ